MRSEKEEAELLLDDLLDELDEVLKKPDVSVYLNEKGVTAGVALLIADGLRAYLQGKKEEAADDLGTAAEEIVARIDLTSEESDKSSGNGGRLLS
ncbi:MAG: hypothetical protein ABW133_00095 [Polyangiaceae bacterium]